MLQGSYPAGRMVREGGKGSRGRPPARWLLLGEEMGRRGGAPFVGRKGGGRCMVQAARACIEEPTFK